ncbi:CHAT domain-containing tetratricopeptide repeat protein [Sphingomonas sp. 28-62-11]|uniref:CHAT domain-containing protein n=1 Tax=Sphingomonas sp. 28-62-11 TaxID=1970432 RepID=UPI000BC87A3F|nr:MAG: hypothetical protein B7Y49_11865 [Sphingomonas sp. 28-62-11]
MARLKPFTPLLLAMALLLPQPAAAAGPVAEISTPVGKTLNGEPCVTKVIKGVAGEPGLAAPRSLTCGQNSEGSIFQTQASGLTVPGDDAASRDVIVKRLLQSIPYTTLLRRMSCKASTWIEGAASGGKALLAIPCVLRDGDWPQLVLVAVNANNFTVADGTPSALPALLTILQSPRANDAGADQQALITQIWGRKIALTRADDRARLTQLIRAGRTANGIGRFGDAETAFREALELETDTLKASDQIIAMTLLDLALNVSNQGRAEEATALFRRAAPLLQSSTDPIKRARLATYLAVNSANSGDYKQALPLSRDAAEAWRKLSEERQEQAGGSPGAMAQGREAEVSIEQGELANALNLQALVELRSDNLIQAYAAASEALQILNKSDRLPRWWKADSLIVLGEISIGQGRLSAAETYYNAGIKLRRQIFGDGAPTIRALVALARGYQAESVSTSAIITYREIFKLARSLPSTSGVFNAEMLVPFAAAIVDTGETLTDPVQKRGLYAEAFDAFQLVQSPLVDKTIAAAATRLSTNDPEIGKLIGQMQDLQRDADFARVKLSYQQSLSDGERSGEAEAALKAQIANDLAAIINIRSTLATKYPAYDSLATPPPVNLDQLRGSLRQGEGILSFLIGRDRSFAQLVTREGAFIARVSEGAAELRAAVTSIRRALEIQGGAINEFNLDEANQLHDLLLGGLKEELAKVDQLIVVPSGPLSNLPFSLLVATPPGGTSYEKADWLVRTKTISYTPSLRAFTALRGSKDRPAPRQALLAFGDPALVGHTPKAGEASPFAALANNCRQGGAMPAGLLRALAPLPDTARELNVVATSLGAPTGSLFLSGNATEENLRKQSLDDYRVLYFATHGLLPGELRCQAEPGLVLSPPPGAQQIDTARDGLLESSEIASLRLNADLVVLSACNTAASDGRFGGGDALSGLAEAFFHAGARNMLVTHWQVPSAATAELMSALFTSLRESNGGSVGESLRRAQNSLSAKGATAHPFFWAAFVVIGDGMGLPPMNAPQIARR